MVQHKVTCPRDCLYLIGVKWTKVNQVFASGAVCEGGAGAAGEAAYHSDTRTKYGATKISV